jgi:hypothetical protein
MSDRFTDDERRAMDYVIRKAAAIDPAAPEPEPEPVQANDEAASLDHLFAAQEATGEHFAQELAAVRAEHARELAAVHAEHAREFAIMRAEIDRGWAKINQLAALVRQPHDPPSASSMIN